ncbi:MAG TPA: hypothetical protein VF867_15310 [Arthrobacter sp.]
MTGARLYRNIPPSQEDLIASLTARYADQGIRFDTGFVGSVPVQCSGRIGRRFFYFRFRGDTTSLAIGNRDSRQDAGRAKRKRRHALRALRRGTASDAFGFGDFFIRRDLRRDTSLDRHPSRLVRYAVIHDVTGEQYNGSLEDDEAAELFVRLMAQLEPVTRQRDFRSYKAYRRGSSTYPMDPHEHVITKPAQRRR